MVGALVGALGLCACGRKGGLDPPPGAALGQEPTIASGTEAGVGPDGRPVAPQAAQRRTPLDWLLE